VRRRGVGFEHAARLIDRSEETITMSKTMSQPDVSKPNASMPNANRPSFAELYERELVKPLFQPWVDALLDGARLSRGDRLLDVACGTGIVARVARERLGPGSRIVGVDLSPLMIAHAKLVAPDLDLREGSADRLPVAADETFDVVTCQQGLQFFPDKPKAVSEMRRVLGSKGRVAVATWRPIEESPFILELQRVAERTVGRIEDRRHGFGDANALASLLESAGFLDTSVERLERTIRFADGPGFARLNAMAIVGMSEGGKGMADEERSRAAEQIVADSEGVLRRYAEGSGVAFSLVANVATARA
jgi:ubiquinone/menaquinone biosynthesis C-methylase UbiE